MRSAAGTVISTWFVSDHADAATFFPQIGAKSNTPEAKAAYWKCIACFFASSAVVNPDARHIFFTNTDLPVVDGIEFPELFGRLGVETVALPITYRLAAGAVSSWGNQFYIFDVIDWIAANGDDARYIVLDSDCLWIKPVDAIAAEIDRRGVLTYPLDAHDHPEEEAINGLSRQGMGRFLARMDGVAEQRLDYDGGEIFAATLSEVKRIAADLPRYWAATVAGGTDAPREEAHLLSVIYAKNGYSQGSANVFIRRIWTTLRKYKTSQADLDLTIWHLPAAKLFGFAELFERLRKAMAAGDKMETVFSIPTYRRLMGVPRPRPAGLAKVLLHKLRQRLKAA